MTGSDATAVVHRLLAAAGSREYPSCLTEFGQLDEVGCDLLVAARKDSGGLPVGAAGAHPRDVVEDVWSAVVSAARCWPDRFLHHVMSDPALHEDLSILDALGEVDRPQARDLLVAAGRDRRAGRGYRRQSALQSLIRLADPQVPDLLVDLVKDRDSSVRFTAVQAAAGHGDRRLIPALQRIVDAARTPPGVRDYALDAIELIAVREGLDDLVPPPNERRIVELLRPAARTADITVTRVLVHDYQRVEADTELALLLVDGSPHRVIAPHGGEIAWCGISPGREAPPVMFRLRVSPE